jgi:hypothetical protein
VALAPPEPPVVADVDDVADVPEPAAPLVVLGPVALDDVDPDEPTPVGEEPDPSSDPQANASKAARVEGRNRIVRTVMA